MMGIRTPIDANHVAAWYLDKLSYTQVNYASPGTNDMMTSASPTWPVQTPVGYGLSFTKNNECTLNTANYRPIMTAYTLDFWLFLRGNWIGNGLYLFCKQGVPNTNVTHGFYMRTTGIITVVVTTFNGGKINGEPVYISNYFNLDLRYCTVNRWMHLGMTYDPTWESNNLNVYANGDLIYTQLFPEELCYQETNLWESSSIPGVPFTAMIGAVSDLRISNIARPRSYFRNIFESGMYNI